MNLVTYELGVLAWLFICVRRWLLRLAVSSLRVLVAILLLRCCRLLHLGVPQLKRVEIVGHDQRINSFHASRSHTRYRLCNTGATQVATEQRLVDTSSAREATGKPRRRHLLLHVVGARDRSAQALLEAVLHFLNL